MHKAPSLFLSRYLWTVRLPSQNWANARELGGSTIACKRPIGKG
ncbi:Uncharacterized protein BC141101_02911 [Bacillus toyonensis]|nr:Uncharacterized protein BC141101_02911 [Bacillus toyonensis]